MDKIQYLSQFNLLNSLSTEDLIEMDQLTSIITKPLRSFDYHTSEGRDTWIMRR